MYGFDPYLMGITLHVYMLQSLNSGIDCIVYSKILKGVHYLIDHLPLEYELKNKVANFLQLTIHFIKKRLERVH